MNEDAPAAAPVIRDRRKVDPVTGEARRPPPQDGGDKAPPAIVPEDALAAALAEVEERTEDLARAQADFANYRRRVERDRELASEAGRTEVLLALLGVLDDIAAARALGELTGPLAVMADKIEACVAKFGLERYGEEGEPFDPALHDALAHQTSPDATGTTIALVIQPGYRVGERFLRHARVGVVGQEE